jgi:hypothetical protein
MLLRQAGAAWALLPMGGKHTDPNANARWPLGNGWLHSASWFSGDWDLDPPLQNLLDPSSFNEPLAIVSSV